MRALRKRNLADRLHLVRDGEEALAFLFAEGTYAGRNVAEVPRVVFLDLKLPKVDGLEVLRTLKADPRTRRIPVVMMTSSHEERDVVASYDLGVNSYVAKPVDFDEFARAVGEVGTYWLRLNQPPPPART